jgi:hypothetical protein
LVPSVESQMRMALPPESRMDFMAESILAMVVELRVVLPTSPA